MNEFELIARLTAGLAPHPALRVGPGDDCAVLDLGLAEQWVLFKTDAVVEGVHFLENTPPEKVGHKALARCLSDVAAMAGTPVAAVVTLALPRRFDPAWAEAVYRGLNALAARCRVAVAGGETTTNPGGSLLSVAVVGVVPRSRCVLRRGSQPGDALLVTGELGGSRQGKHLDFEPRLGEARWLADHFLPHAMIDLSDGLAGDLPHLLQSDHLGAELLTENIPVSSAARQAAGSAPPLAAALSDGEDFELLFTVAPRQAGPLLRAWKTQFPELRLTDIGRITTTPGVLLRNSAGCQPLTETGYVHFADPGPGSSPALP